MTIADSLPDPEKSNLREVWAQEFRHLEDRMLHLEAGMQQHREHQISRSGSPDELMAMRLQAIELELAGCARPKDLEGQRQELLREMRAGLAEVRLPAGVQDLGQQLRGELQALGARTSTLEGLLEKVRAAGPEGAAQTGYAQVGEAVAALAARAELLEQQLKGGGDSAAGEPRYGPSLLEPLEERLAAMSCELDCVRKQLSEAVQQTADGHGAVEARISRLAESLHAVVQAQLPRIEEELRWLREQVVKTSSLDGAVAELDRRSEERLTSVWQELTLHAEAAAARASKLESSVLARLEKTESSLSQLHERSLKDDTSKQQTASDAAELSKQLDGLQWRISWLEWSTNGERRSFSRPLNAKAVLSSPSPSTAAAPAFNQPITEDVEMWAREPGGRRRPRRRIVTPLAPSSEAAGPSEQPGPLRASRSLGRLPVRAA